MATVESYETAKGKRYRVRYRKPDHKQTSKRGFRTKKEADLFAASVEVSKAKGEFIDSSLGRLTIGELGEAYMKTKRASLRESSYVSLEVAWRLRVKPRWGDLPIGGVENGAVQTWVDGLRSQYATSTVMRDYGLLIGILDRAVRERKIHAHAARGIDLPKHVDRTHRYLTHRQVDLLARHAGAHSTLIYTLAYCGLRWGEMIGLKVKYVDTKRGRLTIVENAVQIGGKFASGPTKNSKGRSVSVPAFLNELLAERIEGMHYNDLVFGVGGEYLRRPHTSRGWLHYALVHARTEDETIPMVSPHDLRHTAASLAVSAGANVKAVQRMLGHKSAAITLDVYADLFDEDLEAVATALDKARSESIVSRNRPNPLVAIA